MKIYLIAGYAGSGKSTAAELLLKYCENPHLAAFAAAVKDQVAAAHNIPRHLLETQEGKQAIYMIDGIMKSGRQLLIEHSAYMKMQKGEDIWAELVANELLTLNSQISIIHDWRYVNEYNVLKRKLPAADIVTIRIVRSCIVPLTDPSEHGLDSFIFDFIIENNGSQEELENSIRRLVV